jgi:hypothetical protein
LVPNLIDSPHAYIPSTENANQLIITLDKVFLTYEITVGDKTYKLNEDFTYSGKEKMPYFKPVFNDTILGLKWPSQYKSIQVP